METIEYKKGSLENMPTSVIALGFFDGVHIGHRSLLLKAKAEAEKNGLSFAVFTFASESPGLKSESGRLYSSKEKCELLSELGVERTVIAKFEDVSQLSPEEFVHDVRVDELSCRIAITGEDFRFGKGASGNTSELSRLMQDLGGDAITVKDEHRYGKKISTTMIKELLSEGNARRAAELLSVPYHFDSRIVHGLGEGRRLGTPTVNNSLPNDKGFIARGVYLSGIRIADKFYTGITNIGTCPTFNERPVHAETYILDFSGDVYGEDARIYLLDFIREERRFDSKEELILEIENNVKLARELFARLPNKYKKIIRS